MFLLRWDLVADDGFGVDSVFVTLVLLCLILSRTSRWKGGLVCAEAVFEDGVASDMLFSGGDGRGEEEGEEKGVGGERVGGAGMYEEDEEMRSRRENGDYPFPYRI